MTYCIKCDQCGTVRSDREGIAWSIQTRCWDKASDHYDHDIDVDFCALSCLQAWAAATVAREG